MSHRVPGRIAVVTGLILCGVGVRADEPQTQTDDAQTSVEEAAGTDFQTGAIMHGSPEGGVAAYLLGDGGQFGVGEPISLAYGLIAASRPADEVVQEGIAVARPLPAVDPHNGSWFSAIGSDGQELPYRGFFISWGANKSDQTVSLWPGEFVGRTSEINLSFDFSQPGEYRLLWHSGRGGPGLVSNEIRIEIVPAGEAD